MFLGYDLPDYISEDDIMRFMIKFKQVVVDIEVIKTRNGETMPKSRFRLFLMHVQHCTIMMGNTGLNMICMFF